MVVNLFGWLFYGGQSFWMALLWWSIFLDGSFMLVNLFLDLVFKGTIHKKALLCPESLICFKR